MYTFIEIMSKFRYNNLKYFYMRKDIMHTWSENPKKDMLQHLEMFTYKNNCKKLLSGKIKSNRKINTNYTPNIIDKKASEIAF